MLLSEHLHQVRPIDFPGLSAATLLSVVSIRALIVLCQHVSIPYGTIILSTLPFKMKGLGEICHRDIGNKHSMAVEHIAYILFELAILVVFIDQIDYVQLLNNLVLHD